jgi:hypothetical protein
MPAFFRATVADFLATSPNDRLGALTDGYRRQRYAELSQLQLQAWSIELRLLHASLSNLRSELPASALWPLLLEYPIPRRSKRIDAVLLAHDVILVLEFKIGTAQYEAAALAQVEDYCLDLRDFHAASRDRAIVPLLVATAAPAPRSLPLSFLPDPVRPPHATSGPELATTIQAIFAREHDPLASAIDGAAWDAAAYVPVPNIIAAAEELFASQAVREISHAHADTNRLAATVRFLIDSVADAQQGQRKVICFVTGVPGSGKTLTGLTAVHSPELRDDSRPAGVFLSGNGPLVKIVAEALTREHSQRQGVSRAQARRIAQAFIRNVHEFIGQYADETPDATPHDHVIVFDEAQRAWDAAKSFQKFERQHSEPVTLLSIMDRHPDWAVIIALVGGGQEINDGEAGLAEWGTALASAFSHWEARASTEAILGGTSVAGSTLFSGALPQHLTLHQHPELHLPVSLRAYKAEGVARWVNAVISGDPAQAAAIVRDLNDFPIVLTRSLAHTRHWLLRHTRGNRRCGLVASSGALRLRAYGLELSTGFTQGYAYEEWFLGPPSDVRSSYQLEVAATEFQCQGLELDWVGVCWGNDLVWGPDAQDWLYRRFVGRKWQTIRQPRDRQYLLNKYRVLLTRAREGLIIWVPPGDPADPTIASEHFDAIATYLTQCGLSLEPLSPP